MDKTKTIVEFYNELKVLNETDVEFRNFVIALIMVRKGFTEEQARYLYDRWNSTNVIDEDDILNNAFDEDKITHRVCKECGHLMTEGFCVEGGLEYYCSEECLHKHISPEEWEELYDDGDGDSYWTDWDEGGSDDESYPE